MTAPTAALAPTRTARVAPGSTVVLDGAGSTSATGATLAYTWRRLGAEPAALPDTGPTLTVVAPAAGQAATYRLTVTDSAGPSAPAEVTLHSRLATFRWAPAYRRVRVGDGWGYARH